MIRFDSPTCGAASPTPGAAYMVCTMLSIRPSTLPLIFLTAAAGSLSTSSGNLRILSSAIWITGYESNLSKGANLRKLNDPKVDLRKLRRESEWREESLDRANAFVGPFDLQKMTRAGNRFVRKSQLLGHR